MELEYRNSHFRDFYATYTDTNNIYIYALLNQQKK